MGGDLYFRYGTVSSAKSMALLSVAHNYTQQNKKILCIKPAIDTRDGADVISSKCGLERKADVIIAEDSDGSKELAPFDLSQIDCLLVDECQFLTPAAIDYFQSITLKYNKPIICYGLRGCFRTHLFPAVKRLMEIANKLEEIKTVCWYCNKKALFNLRLVDGLATIEGPSVALGGLESYLPVCARCYKQNLEHAKESVPSLLSVQ